MRLRPLAGIRVLDLTRVISGPFCSRLLLSLGAEVLKIENPRGGDDARFFAPFRADGESVFFGLLNSGKQSVALDLKSEAGRSLLLRLAAHADVLMDNFAPGTLERLGIDPAAIEERCPRLIQLSISGFGAGTPVSARPAYDATIQALSGLMQATGFPDSPPLLLGEAVVDQITALYAAIAIEAALLERERTGRGQRLDLSMLDAMLATMTEYVSAFGGGRTPQRSGNRHPISAPYNCYSCRDGYVVVAAANDRLFERLARAMDHPAWLEDPRYRSDALRRENVEALDREIEAWTGARTAAEVSLAVVAAGVPCAAVQDLGEALEMLESLGRPNRVPVDGPRPLKVPVLPWVAAGEAESGDAASVPRLGGATGEVLGRLLDVRAEEIALLAAEGVIGT